MSGRPAPTSPPATVVAIDLGGTAMKGGVATAAGVLEHTGSRPTEREAGPDAVTLGGRPYAGAHGTAGELGHVVVDPAGPPCACGARGCVEAIAAAPALERRYAELGATRVTARAVVARAVRGEPAAARAWGEAVEALAAGLAAYALVMDPERIVVGGGLAEAGDALLTPLAGALAARLTFTAAPPIVAAELGAEAGCHGAAIAAREAVA